MNPCMLPRRVKAFQKRVCVCSNSRNDVPRVAQRYGTIAAHTRRRASVLVVFVVFSDPAITDRHSDTTIFLAQSSLGADILVHWIGKIVRTCAPGGSRTLDFLRARRAHYPLGQALRFKSESTINQLYTGGLFHCYILDESNCHFKIVESIL